MKQFILCLLAALALTGCGKGSLDKQYVDLIHEATEAVRQAPDAEAAEKVAAQYDARFAEFEAANAEELQKMKDDEKAAARIQEAMRQYLLTRIGRVDAD